MRESHLAWDKRVKGPFCHRHPIQNFEFRIYSEPIHKAGFVIVIQPRWGCEIIGGAFTPGARFA